MKRYFLEVRTYSAGVNKKGMELQDMCTRFHRAVVFSHEAFKHILHDVKIFAKTLDDLYPRTKEFAYNLFEFNEGYRFQVYMRPGPNVNTCLYIEATQISDIYDVDGIELKRLFEENTKQHERE